MLSILSIISSACRWMWKTTSSVVFAVVMLILVAIVSSLGTIIPQRQSPDVYLRLYGEVFSKVFFFFDLTDIFGSPFFMLLLLIVGISLFSCTVKRMRLVFRVRPTPYLLGSFIVHLSILVIYAGAIYGRQTGFSGDTIIEKGGNHFESHGNFYVRLNDFNARFDKSGRPLDFSSDLSVIEGGKEVLRKNIIVNDPLAYKGVKFYQSNYGLRGLLEINGPDHGTEKINIEKGGCATYSKTGQMFHVAEFLPDVSLFHGRTADSFEPTDPVVFLSTQDEEIGWLELDKPVRWGEYELILRQVKEYTGLQVKKDPGIPMVYLGFLLLTTGIGMLLFAKPKD